MGKSLDEIDEMDSGDFFQYFAFYQIEPWDKKIDIHHNRLTALISGMFSKKQIEPVEWIDPVLDQKSFAKKAEQFWRMIGSGR